MGFLSDWFERRRDLEQAHVALRNATRLEQSTRAVAELQVEVERLRRLVAALWSIVRDRLGLDEADLSRLLESGAPESEAIAAASRAATCERCGRATSRRLGKCIYCDAPLPRAGR